MGSATSRYLQKPYNVGGAIFVGNYPISASLVPFLPSRTNVKAFLCGSILPEMPRGQVMGSIRLIRHWLTVCSSRTLTSASSYLSTDPIPEGGCSGDSGDSGVSSSKLRLLRRGSAVDGGGGQ